MGEDSVLFLFSVSAGGDWIHMAVHSNSDARGPSDEHLRIYVYIHHRREWQ